MPQPEVYVAHLGDAARVEGVRLTSELRAAGVPALLSFGERSLRAQLRSADSAGASYAATIGEDEVANGTVVLRDLRGKSQESLPRGDILGRLAELAGDRGTQAQGLRTLTSYFEAAMRRARYEVIEDDGSYYGNIPGLQGVWANADTLEACRTELREVVED